MVSGLRGFPNGCTSYTHVVGQPTSPRATWPIRGVGCGGYKVIATMVGRGMGWGVVKTVLKIKERKIAGWKCSLAIGDQILSTRYLGGAFWFVFCDDQIRNLLSQVCTRNHKIISWLGNSDGWRFYTQVWLGAMHGWFTSTSFVYSTSESKSLSRHLWSDPPHQFCAEVSAICRCVQY